MKPSREITSFIFSQYFSDGLRITLGVLLPSLIFFQFDQLEIGVTISLGALCVSLSDNPGPVIHKRNGMLFCNLFVFLAAILTGVINRYPILLGAEILALCFLFSMFSVYGTRASAVGTAALLIMILTIDQQLTFSQTVLYASLVLAGGLWYFMLSMAVSQIRPYRQAQQELGECIKEVATYIRLKAEFYLVETDFDENYKKLINQQVVVHTHQDSVREMLFKSRMMMKDSTTTGRLLILIFVDVVDLFEQAMATIYDYKALHKSFGSTGALDNFHRTIIRIADELDDLSFLLTSNLTAAKAHNFKADLEQLKSGIDRVELDFGLNSLLLKKILINVRYMVNRTQKMYSYFNPKTLSAQQINRKNDLGKFVSHQDYDIKLFRNNLNFDSLLFRHSIRVALVCFIGYLVASLFPVGHHSYWILLTILVILKPGFSLTKQRNYQRLIGTIVGGLAGAAILIFIKDQTALFFLLLIFMVASFSFQRINYVVSVLFMTPFILILFNFLGGSDNLLIAQERILDTFIGSGIALAANYLILPSWEHQQIRPYMRQVLIGNYNYLQNVALLIAQKPFNTTAFKLSRKAIYVSSANIGGAFQRMASEPKTKQKNSKDLQKFIVLNHILSSYTATLISNIQTVEKQSFNNEQIKLLRKSMRNLQEAILKFNQPDDPAFADAEISLPDQTDEKGLDNDEIKLLTEQLELVRTVTADIVKISVPFRDD